MMDVRSKRQSPDRGTAEKAAIAVLATIIGVILLAVTSMVVAVAILAISEIAKHA